MQLKLWNFFSFFFGGVMSLEKESVEEKHKWGRVLYTKKKTSARIHVSHFCQVPSSFCLPKSHPPQATIDLHCLSTRSWKKDKPALQDPFREQSHTSLDRNPCVFFFFLSSFLIPVSFSVPLVFCREVPIESVYYWCSMLMYKERQREQICWYW